MRQAPWRSRATKQAVERWLADAPVALANIRSCEAVHWREESKHAAMQLADIAERRLAALRVLPSHTTEAWVAVANLDKALGTIEAALNAPEAWAGLPWLFEAQYYLGAAEAYGMVASQLAEMRSKGGRRTKPGSKAEEIRQQLATRPSASSGQIAQTLNVDSRQVRRVRSKR